MIQVPQINPPAINLGASNSDEITFQVPSEPSGNDMEVPEAQNTNALTTTLSGMSMVSGFVPAVDAAKLVPDSVGTSDQALRILEPSLKTINTTENTRIFTVFSQLIQQSKILLNLEKILNFLKTESLLTDLANKGNIIPQIEYLLTKKEQYNNPGAADDMVGLIEDIDNKSKNLVRSFHCYPQLRKVVLAFVDKLDDKHPTIYKMELLLDIMNAKLRRFITKFYSEYFQ